MEHSLTFGGSLVYSRTIGIFVYPCITQTALQGPVKYNLVHACCDGYFTCILQDSVYCFSHVKC